MSNNNPKILPLSSDTLFYNPWNEPYSYSCRNIVEHPINTGAMVVADCLELIAEAFKRVSTGTQYAWKQTMTALFPFHMQGKAEDKKDKKEPSFWTDVFQEYLQPEGRRSWDLEEVSILQQEQPILPDAAIPAATVVNVAAAGAIIPVAAAYKFSALGMKPGSLLTTSLATQVADPICNALFRKVLGTRVSPYVIPSDNPWDLRIQAFSAMALGFLFNSATNGKFNWMTHLVVAAASTTPAVHLVQKYVPGAARLSDAAAQTAEKTKKVVTKHLIKPVYKHFIIPQLACRIPQVLRWTPNQLDANPFPVIQDGIQEGVDELNSHLSPGKQALAHLIYEEGVKAPSKQFTVKRLDQVTDLASRLTLEGTVAITHSIAVTALSSYFVGPVGIPGGRQLIALGMVIAGGVKQSPVSLVSRLTAAGLYLRGHSSLTCYALMATVSACNWYYKARQRFLKKHEIQDPLLTCVKESVKKIDAAGRRSINRAGNWVQEKLGLQPTLLLALPSDKQADKKQDEDKDSDPLQAKKEDPNQNALQLSIKQAGLKVQVEGLKANSLQLRKGLEEGKNPRPVDVKNNLAFQKKQPVKTEEKKKPQKKKQKKKVAQNHWKKWGRKIFVNVLKVAVTSNPDSPFLEI